MSTTQRFLVFFSVSFFLFIFSSSATPLALSPFSPSAPPPASLWVVLVSTSRFWFNYRHTANILLFYDLLRSRGVPDSRILLFLPQCFACDPRNIRPGQLFASPNSSRSLVPSDIEIDYSGPEVSVDNFLRLLTGRLPEAPRARQLLSDKNSAVLIVLTGHGGLEFLKFQDSEELSAQDFHSAINEMRALGRFQRLFILLDTCQGGSFIERLASPDVVALASSRLGENSYSFQQDENIGVSLTDRFSYAVSTFLAKNPAASLVSLMASLDPVFLMSNPQLVSPPLSDRISLKEFFHEPARKARRAQKNFPVPRRWAGKSRERRNSQNK